VQCAVHKKVLSRVICIFTPLNCIVVVLATAVVVTVLIISHDRCEWVNVSSGTGLPVLYWIKSREP